MSELKMKSGVLSAKEGLFQIQIRVTTDIYHIGCLSYTMYPELLFIVSLGIYLG